MQNSQFNTAITIALFIAPIIYLSRQKKRLAKDSQTYQAEREAEVAFLSAQNSSAHPLRPPLPDILRRVLSRCKFAYLSTVDAACNSSHLSLMRFTYVASEEVIIMSTNRKTKKYDMLEKQSGVALPLLKVLLEPVRRALVRSRGSGANVNPTTAVGNGGTTNQVIGSTGQTLSMEEQALFQQQQLQQQQLQFMQQQQSQMQAMDPALQQQLYQQQMQQMMLAQQQQQFQ